MGVKVYIIMLTIATFCLLALGIYIFKSRLKKQINYAFIGLIICMAIVNIGYITAIISETFFNNSSILLSYVPFLGQTFLPVAFLFVGLIFAKNEIKFSYKYLPLFIIPILSNILIWTSSYHRLFFKQYTAWSNMSFGIYFYTIHLPWTYGCVIVGLLYLIRFSIKNAGFFSRQAMLIVLGSIVPFAINVMWIIGNTIGNESLKLYSQFDLLPISFTVTIVCIALAIFKFDFLNIVPVALQRVVDLISDGFVVIDEDFTIIDYNKTVLNSLKGVAEFDRKDNIVEIADKNKLFEIPKEELANIIRRAVDSKKSFSFEQHIEKKDFDKYFTIEITPIFNNDKHIGTIVLLKDITEHNKNLETINQKNEELTALNEEMIATNEALSDNMEMLKQTQNQLVESERLASLGQLIGGIAHNLKTPIMSIAGGLEAIEELAVEVEEDTIGGTLEKQDYIEIAKEIKEWIAKLKDHDAYMSDIITTVKGQAVQMSASTVEDFELDELLKRIDILMKHELKKSYCTMSTEVLVDKSIKIKGEINNLVQILNNLITNAIQAYDEQGGVIELKVEKENKNIKFSIKDSGKGIPREVQEKLFRSMITTKGKKGTGLGLYMSYSTIRGKFSGNMWFESEEGKGTTFYVVVPVKGVS